MSEPLESVYRRTTALVAKVEALREALREAADDIEDWGGYAMEYFQKKHDLAGDVARYRCLAAKEEG